MLRNYVCGECGEFVEVNRSGEEGICRMITEDDYDASEPHPCQIKTPVDSEEPTDNPNN